MNKFTYLNHDTFLQDRKSGIGASEISILCGVNKWKTPLELYYDKIGESTEVISEQTQKLFDAGHENESITLYRFLKKRNRTDTEKISSLLLQKKTLPKKSDCHIYTKFIKDKIMLCHPDFIYNDFNVELKFVKYKGDEWNFNYEGDYGTENDIPFNYYLQCQYQMMITGLDKTILVVNYQGCDHYEFLILANLELFTTFEKLVADFWKLIENKTPPMPQSRNDVKMLFPNKKFTALTVPSELEVETILYKDRYNYLKEKIKNLDNECDKIKTTVMSLMTNNNILQTSNGERIAKITESESERVMALSEIKKDKPNVYKFLIENDAIKKSKSERFYF